MVNADPIRRMVDHCLQRFFRSPSVARVGWWGLPARSMRILAIDARTPDCECGCARLLSHAATDIHVLLEYLVLL